MIQIIDIYLKILTSLLKLKLSKHKKIKDRQQNDFIYPKVYAHKIEQNIDGDGNCYFRNLS